MQTHRLKHWSSSSFPQMSELLAGGVVLILVLIVVGFLGWSLYLPPSRIAHGVATQDGISLSGLTRAEAKELLEQKLPDPAAQSVQVTFENHTWQTDTQTLGLHYDRESMVDTAYQIGRQGNIFEQLGQRWSASRNGTHIGHQASYDDERIYSWVADIAADLNTPGKPPSVVLQGSISIIDDGERGIALDEDELITQLHQTSFTRTPIQLSAPVEVTVTPLSADGRVLTEQRAERLRGVTLKIVADPAEPPLSVPASEFFTWLSWPTGFNTATLEAKLAEQTSHWNREPINAEFATTPDGQKLTAFAPHRVGRTLQIEPLITEIQTHLSQLEQSTELPPQPTVITAQFEETEPEITLESTNSLGIKERIAVGTSTYKGSIPNRIFNVGLTAERLHGSIVAPGEEFSFNQAVGEISGKTGYKSAYVIMNGRTQLGDGGGVCQVSTTLFRAILDGGLPVTRWKAHSYRVGYYEQGNQPGFDATVYAPSVDFRFRNDTNHSIAIAAYPDSSNQFLTIELWGTSDGRESEISDYKIWNQRSAPAPLYVDDPSLPAGKRQQIDWAAAGANTSFQYTVRDAAGTVIHDREFVSIFRPWQAVYLVGTGQ